MCVLLPSGETWNYINIRKERSRLWDRSSPYSEMNTSNLYNKLQEDEQLITESSSDQWDERFEEVTCSLHYSHKFDDTSDVSTTYLGSYLDKDELRTFSVDNHIYVTTCTGIRIGNGSIVPALFVIPILFMACGHTFEIFTIVAEIDDDMDLVFGFKIWLRQKDC